MSIEIHIIKERCKGCNICIEICQVGVLEMSDELNASGYTFPYVKQQEECIDCGMCEMFCPEFAIWVNPIEKEK